MYSHRDDGLIELCPRPLRPPFRILNSINAKFQLRADQMISSLVCPVHTTPGPGDDKDQDILYGEQFYILDILYGHQFYILSNVLVLKNRHT